ncbi:MAG: porin family protein [Bacteroidales bacterium]
MNYGKVVLVCILAGYGIVAMAQSSPKNLPRYDQQKFHFGFTLGINTMDFSATPVPDSDRISDTVLVMEPVAKPGFNIGIVSSMKLAKYLDIRFVPTLSFGERRIRYKLRLNDTTLLSDEKIVESTYIDFPVFLKYKSKRLHNSRAYVTLGGRYSLDLASQAEKGKSNGSQEIKLKPHDVSAEIGVGFEFFLNYFKFGTELKMAYGFLNLLEQEDNMYARGVERLNSKMFWLTFTFE